MQVTSPLISWITDYFQITEDDLTGCVWNIYEEHGVLHTFLFILYTADFRYNL